MDAEAVVIGAGAIGLSIAKKFVENGHSVILLEKETGYGLGVSSRSTETIHAGIYYATGSLKASLCLKGKRMLYEYCARHNVKHARTGKLFIAVTADETGRLELTKKQAVTNGVDDLVELDGRQLKGLAPEIKAIAALFSPSSGIFDSHGFMKSLMSIAKSKGLIFAAGSAAVGAEYADRQWRVRVRGREEASIACRAVINAAGLYATFLSRAVFPGRSVPELYPVKGSYARYSGKSPVKHIIYPAIVPGLIEERVDATPDLSGSLRFGPNVEKTEGLDDFSVSASLADNMTPTIKRYLPGIDTSRLQPDCSGIRPRIYGPQDKAADFCFDWAPQPGWLDLWGMESPGLTASLAIADHVYGLIKERDIL